MKKSSLVGVDTHKDTLACYCNGKFKEFKTTIKGFEEAVKWAPGAIWAIEGSYCFGQPFSAFLIKNGCEVYEVNPKLTKTWRGVLAVTEPKNDYGDAKVISMFAKPEKLQTVTLEFLRLKEIITERRFAVKERTRIINNIKMLSYTKGNVLPFNDLTTNKAISWLINNEDIILRNQGKILQMINSTISEYEKELENNMPENARKLMILKGISAVRAVEIFVEVKGKVLTESQLANYAGIAPVPDSSGKKDRYKTNKMGNRRLNSIFYSLSIAQVRYDENAKKYYQKKLSEGKTPRRARKAVARQLVKIIFNLLKG
jgi:transposase